MTDDPEITDPRDPMKRRDVVAELDRMMAEFPVEHQPLLERARDEIVALRAERDKLTWEIIDHAPERDELVALREMRVAGRERMLVPDQCHNRSEVVRWLGDALAAAVVKLEAEAVAKARDEALEEAARVCEECVSSQPRTGARKCAAAIRALKEKGNE